MSAIPETRAAIASHGAVQDRRPSERSGSGGHGGQPDGGIVGELRFLPAHSPDFDPIETVFAKLKALVRSAAVRCADTLCGAIASALATFTPLECRRCLRHAGYGST